MPRRIGYSWDLVQVLVQKELKLRYRGTSLGILWSLANPLAFALVLHLAFKRIFRLDIENYAVFILAALFPWQWFSNSLGEGANTFLNNSALIKKLPFPRSALCLAVVLGDLTHFLVTVPVLALVMLASGSSPAWLVWAIGVPLLVTIQCVQTAALLTLVASTNAFLRDLGQLVRVVLLLLFYATPILFPAEMVPRDLNWILYLNPLAPLMISWRTLFVDGALSPFLVIAAFHAILTVAVAVPVYRRLEWRLAEVV